MGKWLNTREVIVNFVVYIKVVNILFGKILNFSNSKQSLHQSRIKHMFVLNNE